MHEHKHAAIPISIMNIITITSAGVSSTQAILTKGKESLHNSEKPKSSAMTMWKFNH